jgi:hypothetical protein
VNDNNTPPGVVAGIVDASPRCLPRLIGFCGLRRAGKDTAAGALIALGYTRLGFADALKAMLYAYLDYVGVSAEAAKRIIEGDRKEFRELVFLRKTPRFAMQTLGTEWGRDLIGGEIWVNACMARAARCPGGAVIPDVRFPNEAEAIRRAGGKIIRVTRPGLTIDSHPSENSILAIECDAEVTNDQDCAILRTRVLCALRDVCE